MPAPFEVRFWSKVQWGGPDDCWLWTGALNDSGYGVILIDDHRTLQYAHRVIYERFVGPIPAGLTLDHGCRTRHCVNPRHLEAVTTAENSRRGAEARRLARNAA